MVVVLKGTLVFCFGPKYWFKTEDLAQAEQLDVLVPSPSPRVRIKCVDWGREEVVNP